VQYRTAKKGVVDDWVAVADLNPADAAASQDDSE